MFKNLKFRYIEAEMIPTIEFIENRLNSVGDEVVNLYALDIGANLGLYSEIFKESGLNVIAVEPLPYLANYLEKVFKHSKSVQVLQLAVGNESTSDKITLRVPFNPKWPLRMQDYDQFTTLSISNSLQNATKIKKIDVSVRMIDEIVPKDANVIIIKIDIEGFEFQALQGAKEILRRCHPIILCEIDPKMGGNLHQIANYLKQFSYEGFFYCEEKLQPLEFSKVSNFNFIKNFFFI